MGRGKITCFIYKFCEPYPQQWECISSDKNSRLNRLICFSFLLRQVASLYLLEYLTKYFRMTGDKQLQIRNQLKFVMFVYIRDFIETFDSAVSTLELTQDVSSLAISKQCARAFEPAYKKCIEFS